LTYINFVPAITYIIIEEVIKGEIPNYIKVPLLEAIITLIHWKGSPPWATTTPYNGIYQQTRYMNKVIAVHIILSLNIIFLYGCYT